MSRQRINQVTALLLVLGLGTAVTLYAAAAPALDDPVMDQIKDSKIYQQQVMMLGGELSLVMADFQQWLTSLWHGRALAGTIAALTVAVVFGFRYVASRLDYIRNPTPPRPNQPPEN